ncbi:MAG: DNA recombination protein RmuC [Gammaproteobacteria bacterium]
MDLLRFLPSLLLVLSGFLLGVCALYFSNRETKKRIHQLTTQNAIAEEKLKLMQQKELELRRLQQHFIEIKSLNAELQARIEEQGKHAAEKLKLLQDAEHRLNLQFEHLAGRIFDERNKQFTEQSKTSLGHIVTPLREQLAEFKQRMETVYDHENKDRISLREEIVSLRRDTAQMNQEALNLTRALKGDKKIQGNWGEMILERVLEKSGLRKGIEYETQGAFRDRDHRLFKPDVIVRLPENKDIVIDSKVSLAAYERYCSCDDDQERLLALKQHTDAVREHIRGLSSKDYSALKGLRSLDFVLLFMPIEAAFVAAFEADERLFGEAFERQIIVVTPTTLLATLRTVENIWRYERQNENARIIAEKAGVVYDKIRGFVEDLDKLGKQLNTIQATYDSVMNKLTQGQGNLIRHASSFVDLGVKVRKTLPKNITEQAGIEAENGE